MFFLPHNPKKKVYFPEAGALYFEPGAWHKSSPIQPPISRLTDEWAAFWAAVRAGCNARGMSLSSWMPVLHNSGAATRYPQYAVENAWGDSITHSLCPSHPEVLKLVVNVVGDVADTGIFDRILLESIEYLPLRHGHHHEVIGVELSAELEFLLSLCFCKGCRAKAAKDGLEVAELQRWLIEACTRALSGDSSAVPNGWTELKGCAGGALSRYLELRSQGLTDTVKAVRERLGEDGPTLAILDFGPLYPLGPDERCWQSGVDLDGQLPLVDEVHPTFYSTDLELNAQKIEEYARVLAGAKPQIPAIRAISPQTTSKSSLLEQVAQCAPHTSGFTFYNYGFMPLETLDWIREAIEAQPRKVEHEA
jgi:hypothetical protein